jgi:hypothetical protein
MTSLRKHAAYLAAQDMGDPEPLFRHLAESAGARMGCKLALACDVVYGPGMPRGDIMPDALEVVASSEL